MESRVNKSDEIACEMIGALREKLRYIGNQELVAASMIPLHTAVEVFHQFFGDFACLPVSKSKHNKCLPESPNVLVSKSDDRR